MRKPEWSLVQFVVADEPKPQPGVLVGETIRRAPKKWPSTVAGILDAWREWESELRAIDVDALEIVPDAQLVAPITFPRKVICAGVNYYDHAEEMGTARPDPTGAPYFFLKPPTTTVVGTGAEIQLPEGDARVDWEAELAIVIADRCKNVSLDDAREHVAGYLVANDLSARGLFPRPAAVFPAFAWDWFSHKAPDGFCPIGPGVVPEWLVTDPDNLAITLSVNGVTKQESNTSNMVVAVDRLISEASRYVTLEPGDIILTGTPAGVGMPRQEFLAAGDLMVVEIDGIGRIQNRIVGE